MCYPIVCIVLDGNCKATIDDYCLNCLERDRLIQRRTAEYDFSTNARTDTLQELRRAMRRIISANKYTINRILAKRTNRQRQEIKEAYERMYKRDLCKVLKPSSVIY